MARTSGRGGLDRGGGPPALGCQAWLRRAREPQVRGTCKAEGSAKEEQCLVMGFPLSGTCVHVDFFAYGAFFASGFVSAMPPFSQVCWRGGEAMWAFAPAGPRGSEAMLAFALARPLGFSSAAALAPAAVRASAPAGILASILAELCHAQEWKGSCSRQTVAGLIAVFSCLLS